MGTPGVIKKIASTTTSDYADSYKHYVKFNQKFPFKEIKEFDAMNFTDQPELLEFITELTQKSEISPIESKNRFLSIKNRLAKP